MTKSTSPTTNDARPAVIEGRKGEGEAMTMARAMVGPYLRHGIAGSSLAGKTAGKLPGEPQFDDFAQVIKSAAADTARGEMALPSDILMAQALSPDAIMTELMHRATMNLGDYPLAAERYARLAFKAQSNCRATLEALAKLHQPREQTVRHVHVNEGGQAVVADHFHHHTGGQENAKANEQPHATGTAGQGAALPRPDPLGDALPVSRGEREGTLPNARRQRERCA